MNRPMIGPKEVAQKLGIGESTAKRLMQRGLIRSMRCGEKLWRTRHCWVDEYEQQQTAIAQLGPRERMAMQTVYCLRELERLGKIPPPLQETLELLESELSELASPNGQPLLRAA